MPACAECACVVERLRWSYTHRALLCDDCNYRLSVESFEREERARIVREIDDEAANAHAIGRGERRKAEREDA